VEQEVGGSSPPNCTTPQRGAEAEPAFDFERDLIAGANLQTRDHCPLSAAATRGVSAIVRL
jgi:hypothetical protein